MYDTDLEKARRSHLRLDARKRVRFRTKPDTGGRDGRRSTGGVVKQGPCTLGSRADDLTGERV